MVVLAEVGDVAFLSRNTKILATKTGIKRKDSIFVDQEPPLGEHTPRQKTIAFGDKKPFCPEDWNYFAAIYRYSHNTNKWDGPKNCERQKVVVKKPFFYL